ncbi:sulfotransferase family protein [Streptomyces gobiensis]|uniref:sulfotransferase family protein n=1 Tax=Streptomyces gobiensis TaxID=2875706 RepID=UPI001E53E584|nr:sulfotransferase family protein [Streptomyces gobiensis]UGY93312.1 hypothetical protein test1122_17380 [Streptomyces gobiensis]
MNAGTTGTIWTVEGNFSPSGGRGVNLVLRTVGERTTDLALALAIKHVRPNRVHIVDNVRPFWRAVERMLEIGHGGASHVVFLDADCLILEDLRPFLDANELAYVDCYVQDPFRGRVACGVHITRIDVVERMRRTEPPRDDIRWMLRPESTRRSLALRGVQDSVQYRGAHILHDHFQRYDHIFAKIALRELRSRTEASRPVFEAAIERWGQGADYDVARAAVAHAREHIPPSSPAPEVQKYIESLPDLAHREIGAMNLPERPALTMREVRQAGERIRPTQGRGAERRKVFGVGLPRTGTSSLRMALHLLGHDVAHYPVDQASLNTLARGDGRFPLLDHYDGLADLTTVPCFRELDALHPGAKFILTVRNKRSWLTSLENHWWDRSVSGSPYGEPDSALAAPMGIRRFLQAAVYGCYEFNADRLSRVYDEHVGTVRDYFDGRPDDLLVLDIVGGEGWDKLAPFLGSAAPADPFPHMGLQSQRPDRNHALASHDMATRK